MQKLKYVKIRLLNFSLHFQQVTGVVDEILYLTRNKVKKISDQTNSNKILKKTSENFSGVIVRDAVDDNVRCENVEEAPHAFIHHQQPPLHYTSLQDRSCSPDPGDSAVSQSSSYLGELPQLQVTTDRRRGADLVSSVAENQRRVPITFSWPSLDQCVGQVHNPSVDSCNNEEDSDLAKPSSGVVTSSVNRISSACDSGYSELDISNAAVSGQCLEMNNILSDHLDKSDEAEAGQYLSELQLFHLDELFDRTTHEENCFRELDLSICSSSSDDSKDCCSCSDNSSSLPTNHVQQSSVDTFASGSTSLTNSNQAVMYLAQILSNKTNSIKNHHQHNVSKKHLESIEQRVRVTRGDSSSSLPVPDSITSNNNEKHNVVSNGDLKRRPSLPKVVAAPTSSKVSGEIFI